MATIKPWKLGMYLKHRREALKMARPDVARAIGVTSTYLGMVESGKRLPSLPMLEKLADVLQVAISSAIREAEK